MELVGARQDVAFAIDRFEVSERHACELNQIDRSSYRFQPGPDQNADLPQETDAFGSRREDKAGATVG